MSNPRPPEDMNNKQKSQENPRPPDIFGLPGSFLPPQTQEEPKDTGESNQLYEEAGYQQEMIPQEEPIKRFPFRLMLVSLVLVLILLVLRYAVFVVRKVNVSGTSAEIWQTVSKATGLDQGMFYFSVNEDRVRSGVESNRYLIFDSMEKFVPGTVNVKVTQRRPYAFFTHLGVGYVLAQDGMILEQTRELRLGDQLMKVIGLAVWGQQSPGSLPASTDPAQAETMLELFEELAVWGFAGQVYELDIAESLSIKLQTIDGYTINLGSSNQLHAKVGTVASVVNELRRRQMTGGIIEATRPGEATYRADQ